MRKRVLFLWRQEDTSSLRLFSVDSSGRQMISNIFWRQRLHLLLEPGNKVFDVVVFEGPDMLAELVSKHILFFSPIYIFYFLFVYIYFFSLACQKTDHGK